MASINEENNEMNGFFFTKAKTKTKTTTKGFLIQKNKN